MKDTFLLVDGNSLMHRAFHALPLMDADGVYTNAIYGFLSMLLKVIREENVQYLAVCFDEHGPTFRHTVYADYKAGRNETPPELRQQFETMLALLDALSMAGDLTIQGCRETVMVIRETDNGRITYMVNLKSGKELVSSPVYYLQQNDVVYVEPNDYRSRQTTVNGNRLRSSSFWISLASLAISVILLVKKL